jgi:hypothetical protein
MNDPAARVVAKLEALDCEPKGGQGVWQSKCPVHKGRRRNLSITRGDERVLLHCHAGCNPEAIIEVLGLEWSDLYMTDHTSSATRKPNRRARRKAKCKNGASYLNFEAAVKAVADRLRWKRTAVYP